MATELAKETIFGVAFREFLSGNEPDALRNLRAEAFDVFSEKGFPTQREEDWKYTNAASVGSEKWIVDRGSELDRGVPVELLSKFRFERNGFAALNLAFADVSVVRIPKETSVAEPIIFEFGGEDG